MSVIVILIDDHTCTVDIVSISNARGGGGGVHAIESCVRSGLSCQYHSPCENQRILQLL